MNTAQTLRILIVILLLAILGVLVWRFWPTAPTPSVDDPNGVPTMTAIYTNASPNDIQIDAPRPGDQLTPPTLLLRGAARGPWYFEATAPVTLVDWDGLIIANGYVTATDDWMTEDFVPFEGTLTFATPAYGTTGTLIFHNSNASGLPEYDRSVEVPITF